MVFAPVKHEIDRMFPNAIPAWRDALAELAPVLCNHYAMTRLRWVHFCGQIAAETNGLALRRMEENMNFSSAKRILEVYSYRLGLAVASGPVFGRTYSSKAALAVALVNQPKMLADVVYGGPKGREGTPPWQGHRYIGRGPTQTTHLDNYRAAQHEVARQPGGSVYNLVETPELLATDARLGVRVAFAEWHLKRLNHWADRDDCDMVSDLLNTGNVKDNVKPHGLERRRRETARAKGVWPIDRDAVVENAVLVDAREAGPDAQTCPVHKLGDADAPGVSADTLHSIAYLQTKLKALGYQIGAIDGKFGTFTHRAVVALQSEHALLVDGRVGPRTWDVIATTDRAPVSAERETATTVPGSQQMKAGRIIRLSGTYGVVEAGTQALLGVSPFDYAMGLVEQATAALAKMAPLGVSVTPRIGVTILLGIGGATLWKVGSTIEWSRLIKHRNGEDLSK